MNKNGITFIEFLVLLTIIGIAAAILIPALTQDKSDIYRVWVKQTGNPKDLTFEEWKILDRHYKNQSRNDFPSPNNIMIERE